MVLQPGDLIYASYPRKRDVLDKPSILHDTDWPDGERSQQQIHRRRNDPSGNHYTDITGNVRSLVKTGKRIDVAFTGGEQVTCREHGESGPGFLIGKVDSDEDGA